MEKPESREPPCRFLACPVILSALLGRRPVFSERRLRISERREDGTLWRVDRRRAPLASRATKRRRWGRRARRSAAGATTPRPKVAGRFASAQGNERPLRAALSRPPSIGTFWAIAVLLPDPQIIDFAHLRARLEIQMASLFRAILRMRRKARANWSHASEDSIVASKSFDSRLARFIHPNVLSTTHLLGKTMNPLTVVSVRSTTVRDIRLAS